MNQAGIGKAVRTLRQRKKLTQQDLAVAVGVHRDTISRLEKDSDTWNIDTLYKVCEALDVKPWRVMKYMDDVAKMPHVA